MPIVTEMTGQGVQSDHNIIIADQVTNDIQETQLASGQINFIHVTLANSTVNLPFTTNIYNIIVNDAVLGGGNITVVGKHG